MLRLCEPLGPDLLPFAQDLVALVKDPADPVRGYDLLTRSYATPAAAAGREAIRRDPQLGSLIEERYRVRWPAMAELLALPADSLGHRYAARMRDGGLEIPSPSILPCELESADAWIHQRTRQTHDLWHVVLGCPASSAGEGAVLGLMMMQLNWPGPSLLLSAALMHCSLCGPAAGDADIGPAVAFGLQLSQVCASLLAQRWEEDRHRPLAAWQPELGIATMLESSPFRREEGQW
jgi:ubiquinone biosynthesis protein COQ4